jgi:iron complex outermembrane receptor protein
MTWSSRGSRTAGLLIALLAAATSAARAQDAQLRGRVTEAGTSAPLPEAEVLVTSRGLRTTTDADGRFHLAGLEPGAAEVTVRRLGFAPAQRRVTLIAGEPLDLVVVLSAAVTQLDPVVVTATRDERSLADVAAAVAVADSTVIKSGRTSGLHEVLRYTPGVQATSRYGGDDVNLSIRGSGIRTTFGVRGVAVLLDGVPITEPDGLTRLDLIELATARQVEVVRGPTSALYGGMASGGAVNIISRTGEESRGASLRAQTGAFGFSKYDAYLGSPFASGRGSAIGSGTYTWSEGFRAHNTNQMWRLNLRGDYRIGERTRVGVEGSTSSLDVLIPGALTQAEFDADPYQAAPVNVTNDYARRDERFRTGLRLDQGFGAGGAAAQATGYFFYGGRTLDHPIFQVLDQSLHRVQAGARVRAGLDRVADPRLQLATGFDYDNLFGTDQRYRNVAGDRGPLVADGYIALPSVGVFGQLEGRLRHDLTLTAGARYDKVTYDVENYLGGFTASSTSFDQLSPKVTLAWRPAARGTVYASVSRGFEVPTIGELTVSPDPSETFNSQLQPKTLWNYELGGRTVVGQRFLLDAAVFYADVSGEFLSRTIPTETGPRTVFENAGDSRNIGVELGWTALLTPWLDLVGSYTFTDAKLQDYQSLVVDANGQNVLTDFSGNRLPGVPQHRLTGEFRVRPLRHLQASIGAEWQSKLYVDNANADQGLVYFKPFGPGPVQAIPYAAVPAWAIVHLSASYAFGPATFTASVENLFDDRYTANVTINDGQGRFYSAGAGRFLSLGVTLAALPGGF